MCKFLFKKESQSRNFLWRRKDPSRKSNPARTGSSLGFFTLACFKPFYAHSNMLHQYISTSFFFLCRSKYFTLKKYVSMERKIESENITERATHIHISALIFYNVHGCLEKEKKVSFFFFKKISIQCDFFSSFFYIFSYLREKHGARKARLVWRWWFLLVSHFTFFCPSTQPRKSDKWGGEKK